MKEATAVRARAGKVVLALVAGLLLATAWTFFYSNPASAQVDPYATQTPSVLPTRVTNPPNPDIQGDKETDDDVGAIRPDDRDGVLPFTGGDVMLFVVIGAAAVTTGFVIVRRTRSDS
jgi:hypothetical protein